MNSPSSAQLNGICFGLKGTSFITMLYHQVKDALPGCPNARILTMRSGLETQVSRMKNVLKKEKTRECKKDTESESDRERMRGRQREKTNEGERKIQMMSCKII